MSATMWPHSHLDRAGQFRLLFGYVMECMAPRRGCGRFIRSVVGVEVKLLVSFGLVLHRDTKPSLYEGQVACVHNPTNNRPWSRHTHQAASVRLSMHGAGTPVVHPGEADVVRS
jgi:hypothetical protein